MKQLSLTKPHLIVMVGLHGAGKSHFAERFADTFKAPVVSAGRIRSELFNEPQFNKDESEIIGRVSDYLLDELLKTERTILVDGETHLRVQRTAIQKKAAEHGYSVLFVWVQTDNKAMRTRAKKNGLPLEKFDEISRKFTPPNEKEPTIVISGKHTYASQLKIVLRKLSEPRSALAATSVTAPPRPRRKLIR